MTVNNFKCFGTARREQKVMSSDLVFNYRQHRITAVGIQHVTGGEVDGICVIDTSAGREPLLLIVFCKRNEIRHLFAFRVGDSQHLAALKQQRGTGLRRKAAFVKTP